MATRPNPRGPFPTDLMVFLTVLATGGVLILLGHLTPEALAGYSTALGSLFAVWQHRRPDPERRNTRQAPSENTQKHDRARPDTDDDADHARRR
ncbi:hypothetical protein [Kitasatospora herbaricolor]|uniref:Uncharacterized protein n=1 Tax=Kitasatospora herbaricolor TaxID=68217 RepID=A0ABZ1WJD6_9ACTN|nr:hypothetical protein [Kitasatospora herbaricolor]